VRAFLYFVACPAVLWGVDGAADPEFAAGGLDGGGLVVAAGGLAVGVEQVGAVDCSDVVDLGGAKPDDRGGEGAARFVVPANQAMKSDDACSWVRI
jgi:hypothetical protein